MSTNRGIPKDQRRIATPNDLPTPIFGSAFKPGLIDRKFVVFFGLQATMPDLNQVFTVYRESVLPKGTFTVSSSELTIENGKTMLTAHGYDIIKEFDFEIYDDFPHTLYGSQTDLRYDKDYNLTNPSGDLVTWVSDCKQFMTQVSDSNFFSADFTSLFGSGLSPAVRVYVGSPGTAASNPVASSTYTWYPVTGTVVFNTAQASNAVISIDGRPLGMAPERMLYHLFVNKAGWDATALNLQTSNVILPAYVGGRGSSLWQIAMDIAKMTAPRFVQWQLRVNEYGNIFFYETRLSVTPVATLTDERDILGPIKLTISADNIQNVFRADAIANNGQTITSISFDIDSIALYGQKNTQTIDGALLLPCRGMGQSTALSFCNLLTAQQLHQHSYPVEQITVSILYNPRYQVGDKIKLFERSSGISNNYIIRGITYTTSAGKITMEVRLERMRLGANFNMGFPSAVAIETNNSNLVVDSNSAVITGATGVINNVTIGGITAINNGSQSKDANGDLIVPRLTGINWPITMSLSTTHAQDTWLWRWIYLEAPNSLDANSAMIARLAAWVSNDGGSITAAQVAGGYSFSESWYTGMTSGSATVSRYNDLVVGVPSSFLPSGYNYSGVTLNFTGDTSVGSTTIGVGYGPTYTGNYSWLPNSKENYAFYCVLAVNRAGAVQFLRIPFIIVL